jgi:hypothetical protein
MMIGWLEYAVDLKGAKNAATQSGGGADGK